MTDRAAFLTYTATRCNNAACDLSLCRAAANAPPSYTDLERAVRLAGRLEEPMEALQWISQKTKWAQKGTTHHIGWAGGHVGRAYAITLPERRNKMLDVMKVLGLQDQIWVLDAIQTKDISHKRLAENKLAQDFYLKTWYRRYPGRVACHLSHMAVLNHFVNDPNSPDTALIFEDDLQMPASNVESRVEGMFKHLQDTNRPWDFVFLGYCMQDKTSAENIGNNMLKLSPLCQHAYIITKYMARMRLDRERYMWHHSDNMLQKYIIDYNLNAYGPKEPMIWQDRKMFKSKLGSDRTNPPQYT